MTEPAVPAIPPAAEWFHVDAARQQQGPVTQEELLARLTRGELRADTLVWKSGMADWQPLAQVLPLPSPAMPAQLPEPLPATASIMPAGAAIDRHDIVYAGFWRRFAASVLDSFVIGMASYAIIIPAMLIGGISMEQLGAGGTDEASAAMLVVLLPAYLLVFLLQAVYFGWMHSRPAQATLGKMAVGIKVCRPDGSTISFQRGFGRWFGLILSALPVYIGYVMAGFTDRKRALHDMVSDTVVVDRWAYTTHPQMQKRGLDGVTIAILLIYGVLMLLVVAAVVLMAAVAGSGQWQ